MGDIFCARRATRSADLTAKKHLEKRRLLSLLLLCAPLCLAGCQSAYLSGQTFSFGAKIISIESALKTPAKKPTKIEQDRGEGKNNNKEPALQTTNSPKFENAPSPFNQGDETQTARPEEVKKDLKDTVKDTGIPTPDLLSNPPESKGDNRNKDDAGDVSEGPTKEPNPNSDPQDSSEADTPLDNTNDNEGIAPNFNGDKEEERRAINSIFET